MRNIENTAVNDLIARASGGRRSPSARMAAVSEDDGDGDPDDDPAQLTLPVSMPVAAPFEARPATPSYPVVHRALAVASSPEWPPSTAPEFLEPASPRRLYALASRVDHERLVPTFQMRRRSEVRNVIGKLVFPIALLVSIGIVVGAYVAFGGDRGAASQDLAAAAAAPAAAPEAPAVAPIAVAPVAPAVTVAPVAPAVTVAPVAPVVTVAPVAPAAPVVTAAPAPAAASASPELVEVRIDSNPAGATVMLVDRGRTQLIGDTPVNAAVDPSREYDLVFTSASEPPHVEHFDPRTTRRVEVAFGKRDGAAHPADSAPRRVEHAATEHAAAEHAAAEPPPARASRPRVEPPAAAQGTLMLSSKPPCEILVDGRATGLITPQRSIALPAGSHRITLINSEKSIRKTVSVQIIANTTAKIIEDLMP